jgi:ASC-1-like (ASCH) protein
MSAPVIKLLNFFERFHEACKDKRGKINLMNIMQEALLCDNEDDVFALYSIISNQVKFAFDFLEENTRHTPESLEKVRSHIENSINSSRAWLYRTLSDYDNDPKKYPIYLDQNCFELFRSFANGLPNEIENITQSDVDNLIKEIEELITSLTDKEISFGDKLYLQNLLKRMILTLKNYDKFSLSDELLGDSLSLFYNVSTNEKLEKDRDFFDKAKKIFGKIYNKVKPDKVQLELSSEPRFLIEWNKKADN